MGNRQFNVYMHCPIYTYVVQWETGSDCVNGYRPIYFVTSVVMDQPCAIVSSTFNYKPQIESHKQHFALYTERHLQGPAK